MSVKVIAELIVMPGKISFCLAVLEKVCEVVRREEGCLEYLPTVDLDDGTSDKDRHRDRIVIIEKWESLDNLAAHRESKHMFSFRKNIEAI